MHKNAQILINFTNLVNWTCLFIILKTKLKNVSISLKIPSYPYLMSLSIPKELLSIFFSCSCSIKNFGVFRSFNLTFLRFNTIIQGITISLLLIPFHFIFNNFFLLLLTYPLIHSPANHYVDSLLFFTIMNNATNKICTFVCNRDFVQAYLLFFFVNT